MKVVLVYVGVGVAGFNPDRPPGDREGSWIGHGIASISASLKNAGFDTELIDLRHLCGWDGFAELISKKPADVYGLSISPVDGEFAVPMAKMIKHFHPDCKIVVGGIHPTIFPLRYNVDEIDVVVTGEGEITLVEIVGAFSKKLPVAKKVQGKKPELDKLPWVDREAFYYHREMECMFAPDQKTPSITMISGRGCPFKCTYCQPAENAIFGHPFRMRSPENVIEELKVLRDKYHFKSITFWDDTFTLSKRWLDRFCDLYESNKFKATIAACSRADIICRNEEMVARLASIGLDWFVIGLESGSDRILNLIKKGVTVEQNLKASEICRKYGIKIFGTYMLGLPTETNDEALATMEMIDKINPEHPSPFFFTPIKGTDIYMLCEDYDLILDKTRNENISRTGVFESTIKDVDYDYLNYLLQGGRENSHKKVASC
jgi:anaerobic magnesium-protoporphyrin IX monomethyl ester cyclase